MLEPRSKLSLMGVFTFCSGAITDSLLEQKVMSQGEIIDDIYMYSGGEVPLLKTTTLKFRAFSL